MSTDINLSSSGTVGAASRWLGPGQYLLLLSVAAAGLVFWTGIEALPVSWARDEYSHGFIIPAIALYIFVLKLRATPAYDGPRAGWPGLALVLIGLAIGVIGNLARISDVVTYGMIIWIGGMVLTVMGLRRGIWFWAPVFYLGFMLPLPEIIYWQLSVKLQFISSEIGVGLISMFGVPVFLDGNVIDLGIYKLQVAEACSGLRYLFPLTSFGFLFAVLYQGPIWHKAVLFLSAAPITVLMNSFRIGVIGVLVDSFGISQAEGFLHTFEGWIIFIACIGILYLEAMLLQQLTRNPKPLSQVLELDFDAFLPQLARVRDVVASKALIAATLLTVVVGAGWMVAPSKAEKVPDRTRLILFPSEFAGWSGRSSFLDPLIESVLGADDYLLSVYRKEGEAASVDLFVAFYNSQTKGEGIHSPEVCIPGGGWEVSNWSESTVTLSSGTEIELSRAIIQKGLSRQLVYYWFEQRGRRIANDYEAKFYTVLDGITMQRSDGALVRVITHIGVDEEISAADRRLKGFLEDMMPILPKYVPDDRASAKTG